MHLKKKFWNEMVYFQMGIWDTKEIKSKEDSIIIEWYASTKDLDRHNDIVIPKSFESSLKGYLKNNPILLLWHDDNKSIWTVTKWAIDKKGLRITAEVINNIDNIFERIKNETTRTFSIWFIPKAWQFILNWKIIADENWIKNWYNFEDLMNKETYRKITDMELVEISVVNVPANGNAIFAFKKSLELNKQFIIEKWFTSFNKEEQEKEEERLKNLEKEEEEETEEKEEKEEIKEEETEEKEEIEEEDEEKEEEMAWNNTENNDKEDKEEETDNKSSEKENDGENNDKEEEKEIEEEKGSDNDKIEEEVEKEIEEEKKIWLIVQKTIEQYKKDVIWDRDESSSENLDTEWNISEIEAQAKHIQSLEEKISELETLVKSIPVNKWMVFENEKEKEYQAKWFQSFTK